MIEIRPIQAQDGEAFQSFVRGMSRESRSNRFLHPLQELAPDTLQALVQVDQASHVAMVATEGEDIVGEGRYVALGEGGRGEFAIAVADGWQRRGIGARLLRELIARARRAGIAILVGEVLGTNSAMLDFARRGGFRLRRCPGDATLTLVEQSLA